MRLVAAAEAEDVAALAAHLAHARVLVLHAVVAALLRTPTHVLVVVSVRLAKPFLVELQVLS